MLEAGLEAGHVCSHRFQNCSTDNKEHCTLCKHATQPKCLSEQTYAPKQLEKQLLMTRCHELVAFTAQSNVTRPIPVRIEASLMPAFRYKVPPPALRLSERYRASRLSCRQLHIRKQVKETTGSHDQAAGGEKSKGGRGSKQDVQWVDLQKSLLVVEPDLDCPSDEDWHCLPGQAHYRDFVLSSDPKLLTPGFKIQYNGGNAMKFCLMIRLLHRDDTVRSEE